MSAPTERDIIADVLALARCAKADDLNTAEQIVATMTVSDVTRCLLEAAGLISDLAEIVEQDHPGPDILTRIALISNRIWGRS